MLMPIFSIITVCYNEAAHIRETLDSIVGQTYHDYELIVVDGGSTDGTKDIIEQYSEKITWWCSERDKGIYNAMNKGVGHAIGDYVIFMNGGDKFHDKDALSTIHDAGLDADIIEGLAIKKGTLQLIKPHTPNLERTLLTDCLSHQSTFIRRELLVKYPYDENYKIASDWKFWLQVLLYDGHSYKFVDAIVADMDVNGITYTQPELNKKERDLILAEFLPRGFSGPITDILREHHEMKHDKVIEYVMYLKEHSFKSYHLIRKIAKRLVKIARWKKETTL